MKITSVLLVVSLTLLSGCRSTISPQCNFMNFTRNEELNKIAMSVQVEESRADSERYFLRNLFYKTWETNSTHIDDFNLSANANVRLNKPSVQLLQESLSSSFSDYGYNVSNNSPVVVKIGLLKFLYAHDGMAGGHYIQYAEIETELSIRNDAQIITKKSYKKRVPSPPSNFLFISNAESSLSNCLTEIVREIVLDREIENTLKKVYGIPVPEEQVTIPKVDEKPKVQDSPKEEKRDTIISTGTGFAICENGYIATAHHVIENAASIHVKFQDTEWLAATVVQKSPTNDIAILKVDRNTKHFLVISDKLRQGEKIFTLGYPVPGLLGEEPKYAEGTVSSLTGIVDEASLMQISVPLQPGNSGGPLLNEKAEVVGMATSVARIESFYKATGTLPQNVNWGVKATFIKPLLPADCVSSRQPNEKTAIDPIEAARNAVCFIKVETKQ